MESRVDLPSEWFVTPTGRIVGGGAPFAAPLDSSVQSALRALESSQAAGLFALATLPSSASLPPSIAFWQAYSRQYLTALCQTPEAAERALAPIAPPDRDGLTRTLLSAPPLVGAEYLSAEVLEAIWQDLDAWVRSQVEKSADGLQGFLKRRARHWHQVGRVCFHLAENKHDEAFPFAFLATYIPSLSGQDTARHRPLGQALQQYAGAGNESALVRLLAPIDRVSQQSETIRSLVDSGDIFHPLAWTPAEAHRFLQEAPACEACGVLVRLPDWWRKRPRPRAVAVIGQREASLGAETLLDFNVSVALGDEALTEREWRKLLAGDDGLVLFKGRWVEVDREKLAAALEHWRQIERAASDGALSFIDGMRLLAGAPTDLSDPGDAAAETEEWSFARPGKWLAETLERLRNPESAADSVAAAGLQATLRHYQQTGVEWLWLMSSLGLGACLADDMGLGKTIQILALLLRIKREKKPSRPSLLVLPASLLANWKAELERFAPSLSAIFLHSSEMDKDSIGRLAESPDKSLRGVDLVLTTYGTLARQAWLATTNWHLLVIDEAQAIKNLAARQTKEVKKLRAEARVALTGTPVENRLSDLWSLFDFLCPGLLGSAARFQAFVKRLERREKDRYTPLQSLVRPYILRRLKTDKTIIADLPDKAEVTAYCGLSKRQVALYQSSVEDLANAVKEQDGVKRRGIVLAHLMRFKQICNHPSQLLGDDEYRAADSGKFRRLSELCEEIAARQEKALVFTQFREVTGPLQSLLTSVFGRPGLTLHGGTAVGKRKRLVDDFQREGGPPFFVLSLKAGGTGLNLTAASHVIHFDRWWNPAVESQATDRAFRIGQVRNVLVHKFVCRGTVEERIDQLIEEKRALANDLLQSGAPTLLTEMTDQELIRLVSLDIEKAKL